jgi:ubiquinone/menaquinone biosynthesis C-methylase UbiE
MYKYSPENAKLYSDLGVVGTSYEISFNEMRRMMGNLHGKTALDYGTGTGRSALLLKSLGASRVIGVDHDSNMIAQAKKQSMNGVAFHLMDTTIPLPNNSVDVALSSHVFVESRSKQTILDACREISRVMKPSGLFVVITTNPDSLGNDYVSYRYLPKDNPKSGDKIICRVKGEQVFDIEDTYWTEQDYREILQESGFVIEQATLPVAEPNGWLDETEIAPDIVFKCIKKQ